MFRIVFLKLSQNFLPLFPAFLNRKMQISRFSRCQRSECRSTTLYFVHLRKDPYLACASICVYLIVGKSRRKVKKISPPIIFSPTNIFIRLNF